MTARRSLALLVLIVLLAAGLLWFLIGAEPAEALGGGAEKIADAAAASVAPLDEPAGAVALEREAAPAEDAGAPERSLMVRVIQSQDGSAAAGAEVLLLPLDGAASLPAEQQEEYRRANADEQLDRWGRMFTCDDAGSVRVPVPDVSSFPVGARANGRWGRKDVRNAKLSLPAEVQIELRRAVHLLVLVVDESRSPVAGVPVVYRKLHGRSGDDFAEAVTDEDGIARLAHLQEQAMRPMNPECDEHVVALGVATNPTVQAAFNPLAPPAEPIVLVLPATGSVEIAVLDAAGKPVTDGLQVVLQTAIKFSRPSATPDPRLFVQGSQGSRTAQVQGGVARFERVGLGLDLEFGADFSRTGYLERRTGQGPQRTGELVQFELRRKEQDPVLSGRVVDEAGEPLREKALEAAVILSGERALHQARFSLRTDSEGRFQVEIPDAGSKTGLTHLFLRDATPGLIKVAAGEFTAPLAPGTTDLGDLLLGGPLLISGIAIDEEKLPCNDVEGRITLERLAAPTDQSIRGPFHYLPWQSGEDGRFEVRGAYPAGRYRITGFLTGKKLWYCKAFDFEPGGSEIVLEFHHLRGVYGRILVDDDVPAQEMSVTLVTPASTFPGGISPNGEFSIHRAEGGVLDLVIRTHENGEVIWTLPRLVVDPALYQDVGEIDLRGKLVTTHVSVLGAPGNSDKSGGFYALHESGHWVHTNAPYPHTFLSLDHERVVWISVGGSILTEVRLDGMDKTVRLPPTIQAAIQIDGLPPLLDDAAWRLTLRAGSGEGLPFTPVFSARVNPSGSAEVTVWVARTGPLHAELSWKDPGTESYSVIDGAFGDPAATIELLESESRQEFRLLADAAAITRAMGKE